jgi:hypothetical protein
VTAIFIPLSTMLYIFLRARTALLPLVVGGAVGSIPTVFYAATTFDKFLYCNATYHVTAPMQYYTDIGQGERLTLPYRLRDMVLIWASEPALVVAALFIAFVAFTAWRRGQLFRIIRKLLVADRIFIVFLMFAAIPFVLMPTPAAGAYLAPAVPYVLLSCAASYPLARRVMERQQLLLFVLMAVVVLALQVGRFVIQADQHLSRLLWTTAEVLDLSALIARHVKGGAVATVYPVLVFDAGGQIYPEFATGVFFFRSGDHVPPERVLELNGISPRTLPLVFGANAPAAVFIGDFIGGTSVDRPLLNWAMRNCYNEIDLTLWKRGPYTEDIWKPRLFMRPREPESCL